MKLYSGCGRPTAVSVLRATLALGLCAAVWAPLPAQDSTPNDSKNDQFRFRVGIDLVTAPVTVSGPDGRYVAGLEKEHFRVFDDEVQQQIIGFDVSFLPISLVLCVESSGRVESLLPKIKKTGILYSTLVLGEQGEGAIISFDSRVEVVQDFTNDSTKLTDALKKIKPGSDATRMSDAVWRAIRMLRTRPDNHRKVIVVMSESRENGSETHMGETVRDAQLSNIMIYAIQLSAAQARLTRPAGPPRRDPFPPGVSARPTAPGVVSTPTTQAQSHVEVVNAIPLIVEAIRGVKNLIFNDPLQFLTEATGGKRLSSLTEEGMQEAVSLIGEELRSQYLLSYRPNNLSKGGFHEIRVEVAMNGLKTRTRPGYWLGPVPKE